MTAPFRDMVTIGRVVKPQGRKGEVLAEPLSATGPTASPRSRRAFVPGPGGEAREVRVTSCWPHKGRFVLKLEGVDSIDDAERYRGPRAAHRRGGARAASRGLVLPPPAPRPPGGGPAAGRPLGAVADLLETGGGATILVVRGPEGELLIPLAEAFVKRVEVAAGRLVAKRPEFLPHREGAHAH